MKRNGSGLLLIVLLLCLPEWAGAQEPAVFTGQVTGPAGEPLSGVSVMIESLGIGVLTGDRGHYLLRVPAARARGQRAVLTAHSIGYRAAEETVEISPGSHTVVFQLETDVLNLEAVVVTGVAGETSRRKLAFTVDQVSTEELQQAPPASNPVQQLQGRVAGVQVVGSGATPGEGVSVRLRGTTSVTGTSQPLYIVDGVILAGGQVDIEPQDIESIEVVKGAAASSIYGSRAQNGVVQITTKRGRGLAGDEARIIFRSEIGANQLTRRIPRATHHIYMVADAAFVDAEGNQVNAGDFLQIKQIDGQEERVRATYETASVDRESGVVFQDNPFPGQTFDHLDRFFEPGLTVQNYLAVARRTGDTNFRVSFGNVREQGVVQGLQGYERTNARINLDHRLGDQLDLSVTGYWADAYRDDPRGAIDPFRSLYLISPTADLLARNAAGELEVQPDPRSDVENPLYVVENTDIDINRQHLLGNGRLRYRPVSWLSLEGAISYDRTDFNEERFFDKGFQTVNPADFNNGRFVKNNNYREAINGNVAAFVNRSFGEFTTRTRANLLVEREYFNATNVRGDGLATKGVRDLANVIGSVTQNSVLTDQRGVYGFLANQTDYKDRYILDLLVRRDGSSLFGPEERWHTYFRASGAYRISEEPWWPLAGAVDEFKVRYSYGTAGAQPNFAAQYETFGLVNGNIVKQTLGNRFLKPELQREQEVGLNMTFFDRFNAEVVYADAVIEDQLLRVPLSAPFGYSFQWRNAGTVESNTVEASLDAILARGTDRSWTIGMVFDRTRQRITEFDLPAFRAGPFDAFQYQAGEELGAIYGHAWVRGVGDLPEQWQAFGNAFAINDEGYLVAVGAGNTWRDGIASDLWGTTVDVDGDGVGDFEWGMPIKFQGEGGAGADRVKIGSSTPDFNVGMNSSFRWRGLNAFMLWNAQVGGEIYNRAKQRAFAGNALAHGDLDQAGKPDHAKKPVSYYQTFYETSSTSSYFIEDASFLKLRELSLAYQIGNSVLRRVFGAGVADRFHSASIGLVGRNLLTFTGYSGYDPEVGLGDATLLRFDDFQYPNYRTLTGRVEFQF